MLLYATASLRFSVTRKNIELDFVQETNTHECKLMIKKPTGLTSLQSHSTVVVSPHWRGKTP
ncbi:hypothetical protein Leryth_024680 [Lithospermum erythrorhizon]|nr:hypothetical protein Leryth_024680 [Lithospermum erythrorhizon]